MKKLVTSILMMVTMSSYSQMVKTKHGWDFYSKTYSFQEYGEKATYFSRVSKLSFNENDNGLMIIYTNGQTETYHLTQVDPIFTSETDAGHKYDLHGTDFIQDHGFYCGNYPELTEIDLEIISSCLYN